MGFEVVKGSPRSVWVPIVDLDTVYVGQIVGSQGDEGISPVAAASGVNDASGLIVPMGVVIGTSLRTPIFDTTYKADKITDVAPSGAVVEMVGIEGHQIKGGKEYMAKVAIITPETILKGQIFNTSHGTALTVGTLSAATTVTATSGALDVAGVAVLSTLYFRDGINRGIYRITDDSSTTALTWDKATPVAAAVGDHVVRAVGLRIFGPSRCQFDSESMFIDGAAALTSDYYGIDVLELDLSEAGKEYVIFKFNADHFCLKRA